MKTIDKFVSKNIRAEVAHKRSNFRYSPVFLVVASLCGHLGASAQQLSLEQEPPVAVARQPAPNLIITIDDSGSMRTTVPSGSLPGTLSDVEKIRTALDDLIVKNTTLFPDGSIRLGFNYMNYCHNFSYNGSKCDNAIRVLDDAHRKRFRNWLYHTSSGSSGSTPSHRALWSAATYLGTTPTSSNKDDNPWAAKPGVIGAPENDSDPLSCRRNYVIFFTDGAFNQFSDSSSWDSVVNNADGQTRTLPDGNIYDITSNQTLIYRDGGDKASGEVRGNDGITGTYSTTLADIAFHFWATDLQPLMTNDVKPIQTVSSPETYDSTVDSVTKSVTLDPYWNPKNDPATWQHINFYTIGYHTASSWSGSVCGATRPDFDWGNVIDGTWSTSTSPNPSDYPALVTGNIRWPNPFGGNTSNCASNESIRYPDIWHMALNSRGRFVPVSEDEDLTEAFRSILSGLEIGGGIRNSGTTPTGSSSSAFSTDSKIFIANFDPDGWQGDVSMYEIQYTYSGGYTTGTATATASLEEGWKKKTAGSLLTKKLSTANDLNNRFVMMKGFASDGTTVEGKLFKLNAGNPCDLDAVFTNFSEVHRNGIFNDDTAVNPPLGIICQEAVDKINYIRGDRSNEIENGGTLRNRSSSNGNVNLLGDIVNSNIWFTPAKPASDYYLHKYHEWRNGNASKRAPMIYVGANDGMLHGFDADTGEEKIAYVPSAFLVRANGTGTATIMVTPNDNYAHRYYADGPVFTADVDLKNDIDPDVSGDWRTYLVGALGAGGKGYYILDVTDPKEFQSGNEKDLLIADTSDGMAMAPEHASYIGHIFGEPVREQGNTEISRQIAMTNSLGAEMWAFITNNGYNSAKETPALFVHILNTDMKNTIIRLDVDCAGLTGCDTSNGLSTPRLIDLNGDSVPDVAYAGDLKGNVWRFNLASGSAPSKGHRIFTATDPDGNPQPITSAPIWMAHPSGGIMLAFGTGRLLTSDDRTDEQTQTIYGIYDSAVSRGASEKAGALVNTLPVIDKSDLVEQKISDSIIATTDDGNDNLWSVTTEPVDYKNGKKGWYLNLPAKSGERVIENPGWFGGKLIHIYSQVPAAIQTASSSNPTLVGESCDSVSVNNSKSYRTTINIINGNAPTSTIYNYTPPTGPDVGNAARIEYPRGFLVNDGKHQYNICPGGDCSAAGLPGTGTLSGTSIATPPRRIAVEPSWIQVR